MLRVALKRNNNPLDAITKLFHFSDLNDLQKAEKVWAKNAILFSYL